jgi:hypothetical protein
VSASQVAHAELPGEPANVPDVQLVQLVCAGAFE